MKLFKNKTTGKMYITFLEKKNYLIGFDGVPYTGSLDEIVEVPTTESIQTFRRSHIVEDSFSIGCNKNWHLKDILYIPVDGKEVPFRVEHISEDKVYFVSVDIVGLCNMNDMADFLDGYLEKMPQDLVDVMKLIEHKSNGNLIRRSKLTLLSRRNVGSVSCGGYYDGEDDIPFDGLQTEAELCKNYENTTRSYWLDSPHAGSSTYFVYVGVDGTPDSTDYANGGYGVVPCFSI